MSPAARRACAECGRTDATIKARGLCNRCYLRFEKAGELDAKYPAFGGRAAGTARPCLACGEIRPHKARGLCSSCYNAFFARGELDAKYPQIRKQSRSARGQRPEAGGRGPAAPASNPTDGTGRALSLYFEDEDDLRLFEALNRAARKDRRLPSQQALWLIEQALVLWRAQSQES